MNTTDNEDSAPGSSFRAKVALHTLGCKLNQAESESLARTLINAGYCLVTPDENPDVYILNTCTVTHVADRKCRQHVRSFHRRNPNALILAVGCYPDRDAATLSNIEGIDLAIGNANKDRVAEIIGQRLAPENIPANSDGQWRTLAPFRTRTLVKVQNGCNHHCSYCIVPHVRGRERSVPVEVIVTEVQNRVDEGCKEVVLTGTRIGQYGDKGGLEELVQRILDDTALLRLRLSSLQPSELSSSLVQLWKNNTRVCRHVHLALQSGSDSVLQRMGRQYSTAEYEDAVNTIRDAMHDIAITTDVIIGFPGESEAEFEESYRFCERIAFAGLHVFPYSVRPGTIAAKMHGRVSEKVKKDRSQKMLGLANQSKREYCRKFLGAIVPVLWEEGNGSNLWIGHTDNYIKVTALSREPLHNLLLETQLRSEHAGTMWGEIETNPCANKMQPGRLAEGG